MNKFRILMCFLLLLVVGACQKKQDLVQKAFEDKDFDNMLPQSDNADVNVETDEPEDKETGREVLLDNLPGEDGTSVFTATGEEGREVESPFKNDPEAPGLYFDETPMYEIIRALCGILEVNYIIDPSVKDQAVTINIVESNTNFKTSELFDLILKLHDLTMVVHPNYVHVVPIDAPMVNPGLPMLHGSRPNANLRKEELAIQVIPLEFVRPGDITTVIKEFLSPSARIYEEPLNNVLVIVDKYQYIAKVMELIPIFDVDVLQGKKMVFYELVHVDAVETGDQLREIMSVYGFQEDTNRMAVVPIETLNGILVVSNADRIFKELDFWIEKFDQEASYEEEQVFVYQVENTTADSISNTLAQLYGLQVGRGGGNVSRGASNRRTTSPNFNSNDRNNRSGGLNQGGLTGQDTGGLNRGGQNTPGTPGGLNSPTNNDSQFNRNITNNMDGEGPILIVDEDNNALIFNTTPREYSRISKTLKKLDILPRQVFLEVTVLSVDLDSGFELGLDWSGSNENSTESSQDFSTSFGAGSGTTSALSAVYTYTGLTNKISATLSALKNKGYANVLQQPHIMAIDNKAASIAVGTDIPITTTRTNLNTIVDGGANNPGSASTVEYRQTGVSLGFTPHINANGVIRLEITLDISQAQASTSSGTPPISQNTLQTEMIVRDNQTVVMGGLIFNQEEWTRQSVPLLGRIPLLKHLFTNRKSSTSKSELIVMITPRLVDSEEKSIKISKEFKEKILKEFETFRRSEY